MIHHIESQAFGFRFGFLSTHVLSPFLNLELFNDPLDICFTGSPTGRSAVATDESTHRSDLIRPCTPTTFVHLKLSRI
jgi:hypothetical protein